MFNYLSVETLKQARYSYIEELKEGETFTQLQRESIMHLTKLIKAREA